VVSHVMGRTQRLRVSEDVVPSRICRPKGNEVLEWWRKLNNADLMFHHMSLARLN
jgi:hypothetical protein